MKSLSLSSSFFFFLVVKHRSPTESARELLCVRDYHVL